MKYTVFFVEDEITIREKIRESIDWETTDFEYLGDAPDGEIALTRILELKPDIVVTDIRMPHMDGLELSRGIQHELPDTYVIILSGFNDFEYAQRAINLNVSEYLLKPITPANLIKSLNNASLKITKKRKDLDEVRLLKEEVLNSRAILKERFLQSLMTGMNPVDALLRADEFDLNLRSSFYSVIVFRSKTFLEINELIKTFQELGLNFPIFRVGYREAGMIAMSKDIHKMKILHIDISKDLDKSILFSSNPVQTECGIIVNRLSLLSKSFQDACAKIDSQSVVQISGKNKSSNDNENKRDSQGLDSKILEDFLNLGLLSEIDAFIDSYLMIFLGQYSDRKFSLYLLFQITFVIKTFMEKHNINEEYFPDFTNLSDEGNNFTKFREEFKTVLEFVLNVRDEQRNSRQVPLLSKVRQKIDAEFFDKNISLNSLAKNANVSPSYLSTLFKQQFDKTITKYIIEKRLEKAMVLLRTTNKTISEISSNIGYSNSNYFSVLFRKQVGKTPREYRNEK